MEFGSPIVGTKEEILEAVKSTILGLDGSSDPDVDFSKCPGEQNQVYDIFEPPGKSQVYPFVSIFATREANESVTANLIQHNLQIDLAVWVYDEDPCAVPDLQKKLSREVACALRDNRQVYSSGVHKTGTRLAYDSDIPSASFTDLSLGRNRAGTLLTVEVIYFSRCSGQFAPATETTVSGGSLRSQAVRALRDRLVSLIKPPMVNIFLGLRALDPLLYGSEQYPLLNIIWPRETWEYLGCRTANKRFPVNMELWFLAWDETESTEKGLSELTGKLNSALHNTNITLDGNVTYVEVKNHVIRQNDRYPLFVVDIQCEFAIMESEVGVE